MEKLIDAITATINTMDDNSTAKVEGYDTQITCDEHGNLTFSAGIFNEIIKLH